MLALTVDDHQDPQGAAEPDEDETFLAVRVVGIRDDETLGILEDRTGLVEADPVLAEIGGCLGGFPFKAELAHTLNVCTPYGPSTFRM